MYISDEVTSIHYSCDFKQNLCQFFGEIKLRISRGKLTLSACSMISESTVFGSFKVKGRLVAEFQTTEIGLKVTGPNSDE